MVCVQLSCMYSSCGAYTEVLLFSQPRGKMTGERRGAPSTPREVGKEESEDGECVCVRARSLLEVI